MGENIYYDYDYVREVRIGWLYVTSVTKTIQESGKRSLIYFI
jgi:hypothetical protein